MTNIIMRIFGMDHNNMDDKENLQIVSHKAFNKKKYGIQFLVSINTISYVTSYLRLMYPDLKGKIPPVSAEHFLRNKFNANTAFEDMIKKEAYLAELMEELEEEDRIERERKQEKARQSLRNMRIISEDDDILKTPSGMG